MLTADRPDVHALRCTVWTVGRLWTPWTPWWCPVGPCGIPEQDNVSCSVQLVFTTGW